MAKIGLSIKGASMLPLKNLHLQPAWVPGIRVPIRRSLVKGGSPFLSYQVDIHYVPGRPSLEAHKPSFSSSGLTYWPRKMRLANGSESSTSSEICQAGPRIRNANVLAPPPPSYLGHVERQEARWERWESRDLAGLSCLSWTMHNELGNKGDMKQCGGETSRFS